MASQPGRKYSNTDLFPELGKPALDPSIHFFVPHNMKKENEHSLKYTEKNGKQSSFSFFY